MSNYHAPIMMALRDINQQIDYNAQQKRQLENDLFDKHMQRLDMEIQLSDPIRKNKLEIARQKAAPRPVRLPYKPTNDPKYRTRQEQAYFDIFKTSAGYEGKRVIRDKETGYAVDENGEQILVPGLRADQLEQNLAAHYMGHFWEGSDDEYFAKLNDIDRKISDLEGIQGKNGSVLKSGSIEKLKQKRAALIADRNNPIKRIPQINNQLDRLRFMNMQLMGMSYSGEDIDNINKSIESLRKEKSDLLAAQTKTSKSNTEARKLLNDYDSKTGKIVKLFNLKTALEDDRLEIADANQLVAQYGLDQSVATQIAGYKGDRTGAISRVKNAIKSLEESQQMLDFNRFVRDAQRGNSILVREIISNQGFTEEVAEDIYNDPEFRKNLPVFLKDTRKLKDWLERRR